MHMTIFIEIIYKFSQNQIRLFESSKKVLFRIFFLTINFHRINKQKLNDITKNKIVTNKKNLENVNVMNLIVDNIYIHNRTKPNFFLVYEIFYGEFAQYNQ